MTHLIALVERLRQWWRFCCSLCRRRSGVDYVKLAQPIWLPPGKHYLVLDAKLGPSIAVEGSSEHREIEATMRPINESPSIERGCDSCGGKINIYKLQSSGPIRYGCGFCIDTSGGAAMFCGYLDRRDAKRKEKP